MVNTERFIQIRCCWRYYNILNIVVNTERDIILIINMKYYNILNIVVNTEPENYC